MTHGEIIRSYQSSKDPDRQIKILSDLTLRTIPEIKEILINKGVYKEMVKWTKEKDAELLQLRSEKVPLLTIAEKFGTTEKAIKNRLYRVRKAIKAKAAEVKPVEITDEVKPTETDIEVGPQTKMLNEKTVEGWADENYAGSLRLWAEILYGNTYKHDQTANMARTLMRGAANKVELLLNEKLETQTNAIDTSTENNESNDVTALIAQILNSPVKANKRITLNADGTARISIDCIS